MGFSPLSWAITESVKAPNSWDHHLALTVTVGVATSTGAHPCSVSHLPGPSLQQGLVHSYASAMENRLRLTSLIAGAPTRDRQPCLDCLYRQRGPHSPVAQTGPSLCRILSGGSRSPLDSARDITRPWPHRMSHSPKPNPQLSPSHRHHHHPSPYQNCS